MLELSSDALSINLTIFPKNIVFLKGFYIRHFIDLIFEPSTLYQFFPTHKARNTFLKKCLLLCSAEISPFNSNITVVSNLRFLGKFFSNTLLNGITLKQFKLNDEILNKKIKDVTKEERFLLSLEPIFLKEYPIIFVDVEDVVLSKFSKEAMKSLLISKASNSNAIVFYITRSGESLNFENELCLIR